MPRGDGAAWSEGKQQVVTTALRRLAKHLVSVLLTVAAPNWPIDVNRALTVKPGQASAY